MDMQQIMICLIALFVIMAFGALFNAIRTIKKISARSAQTRLNRLTTSPVAAYSVATNIANDIKRAFEQEIELAKKDGKLTPTLEDALLKAEAKYLSQVEPRYRTLFSKAVSEIVFDCEITIDNK